MGIVIGSSLITVIMLIIVFKLGLLDTVYSHLAQLCLWSLMAIILSKTILTKRTAGKGNLLSFRELVITLSLVFAAICANVGTQAIQIKVFGYTYTSTAADPESETGSAAIVEHPSVVEKIAKMAVAVAAEEIPSRWITLGALLMLMPAGWALFISSLLFALQHAIVPTFVGLPEIGFFRIAPTFTIGVFAGLAFIRSGLAAAILVHFLANMVGLFADNQTFIADGIIFGSAAIALVVFPLTVWFTKKSALGQRLIDRKVQSWTSIAAITHNSDNELPSS